MAEITPEQLAQLTDVDKAALGYNLSINQIATPTVFLDRLNYLYSPSEEDPTLSNDDVANKGRFSLGTGARSNALQNLVSPGGKFNRALIDELVADYDPDTNTFRSKIDWAARAAGVTDDDVVKKIGSVLAKVRADNPTVRQANRILEQSGREGVKQTTSAEEIRAVLTAESKRQGLLDDIGKLTKGGAFLSAFRKKHGGRLSNPQLQQVLAQATFQEPKNVLDRESTAAQTAVNEEAVKASQARTGLDKQRLDLDREVAADKTRLQEDANDITRTQAANQLEIQREQLGLNRAELEGKNTRQQQLLNHQTAIANKNTDLQLALAQMNRADKSADREYDRERDTRDRRQALMLMLMQGLGNIGKSFGAGL